MIFSKLFKKHDKKADAYLNTNSGTNANNDIEAVQGAEIPADELVAIITAALQSSLAYEPQNKLVIKSIKRTGIASPIWNKTGRMERLAKKL